MTRKGEGKSALYFSVIASGIGSIIGLVVLLFFAPVLSSISGMFGPPAVSYTHLDVYKRQEGVPGSYGGGHEYLPGHQYVHCEVQGFPGWNEAYPYAAGHWGVHPHGDTGQDLLPCLLYTS